MVLGLRGFPDVQGGVEKHSEHLYPKLVRLGCDVNVIVRTPYFARGMREWNGVRLTRLWSPHVNGIEAFIHTFLGVLYAAVLRPDVLHIHAVGPAIMTPLARLMRLKVIVTHHGPDYDREKWGWFARGLLRLGERWGMRYANQRIVISEVIKNLVQDRHGVNSIVIPNGVDIPEIPATTGALDKFGIEKQKYILMVGRLVPEKRHLDLINAFSRAKLQGYKLVIVGDADHPDEYTRVLNKEASKCADIVLTGYQCGLALQELYAHAALFVLPSSHEGLPIAMLEALSYGLQILASNIPANLEVGLPEQDYFPLGNVIVLANLMRESIDRQAYLDNGSKARLIIKERYNWASIAQQVFNVYELAIN